MPSCFVKPLISQAFLDFSIYCRGIRRFRTRPGSVFMVSGGMVTLLLAGYLSQQLSSVEVSVLPESWSTPGSMQYAICALYEPMACSVMRS